MIIDRSSIIPPYFRFREDYMVARKHRLAMCRIENAMSEIQDAIFCYLTNSQNITLQSRTITRKHLLNR
ncbi:hypothetical protein ANCCAN_15437 [Ancylostoma caninum]|uniref:Uncharacterized protein n=1 Tax=Ancylostoma caninum TaxID=29170 RepID=A0A368G4N8_ANCCA|nr:hypothetical protein ANCCAN_15437 [Ancylostoma caninum]